MAKDQKPLLTKWRRLAKTLWRKPIRLLTPISIFSRSPFHRFLRAGLSLAKTKGSECSEHHCRARSRKEVESGEGF